MSVHFGLMEKFKMNKKSHNTYKAPSFKGSKPTQAQAAPPFKQLSGSQATGLLVLQEKKQQIFSDKKIRFAKNVQCTLNIGIEIFLCCETSLTLVSQQKNNGGIYEKILKTDYSSSFYGNGSYLCFLCK